MSRILGNTEMPGNHRLLRVQTPGDTRVAAGQWFRLALERGDLSLAVLDHSPREGWLAFCAPPQTGYLARGAACSLDGPHGKALQPATGDRRLVLVSDETGLPAAVFATMQLDIHLVLVALEGEAPAFRLRPSRFLVSGMGPGAIAGVGVLEDAGVASRVVHASPLPGCREGALHDLVDDWLADLSARERWDTAVTILGTDATVDTLHHQLRGRVGEVHLHPLPGSR